MPRLPTYFISHGGGPWPWMPDWRAMFKNLEASFVQMVKDLPERPKAILMISGHWEDDSFAVMSAARPGMVYDYGGFPPETYQIKYPAPGAPDLAQKAADLIKAAGLPVHAWTLRKENAFLPPALRKGSAEAATGDFAAAWTLLAAAGVEGVFTDDPALAVPLRRSALP